MAQFFRVIAKIAVCGVVAVAATVIFGEPIDIKWWGAGLVAFGAMSLMDVVFDWE